MEAEMVPSLSPLIQAADEWREVLLLLPLLVGLEAVLSADNAIALAAISRRMHDPQRQRQALNFGLLLALIFRLALIVAARWVLDAWPLQLLAAGYLLWLCGRHLLGGDEPKPVAAAGPVPLPVQLQVVEASERTLEIPPPGSVAGSAGASLASVVLTLALTDLAFSLDSVAAAVAVTDRLPLVMAGGVIGVIALRLTAGLFIRWLEEFRHLESAGYLAVGLVGIRLLLRLALPAFTVPEWILLLSVALLFVWGFSVREPISAQPEAELHSKPELHPEPEASTGGR
jgi:YkoY family integral membrane protein